MLGWIEIQTHDVDQFFSEVWIVRNLGRLRKMRLQSVVTTDTTNGIFADTDRSRYRSRRRVHDVRRSFLCGFANDLRFFFRADDRRATIWSK